MAVSPTPAPRRGRIYLGLLWKILLATLVAGLIPLLVLGWSAIQGSQAASDQATRAATQALDSKALDALNRLAADRAGAIAGILDGAVADTLSASALPRTAGAYLTFVGAHQREIRYPDQSGKEQRATIPLYREIAYVDATGHEQVHIQDGAAVPPDKLRDVSVPANTTYLTETYFSETKDLPAGQVYVSHFLAWHTSSGRQPAMKDATLTTDGARYGAYKAEIRIATPVFNPQGAFDGMVVLSLDARHLIEQVIHILPSTASGDVAWPDVASQNYAFMWDDEGYFIAHPSLSGIRGLDSAGRLIPPATDGMPADEKTKHPFSIQNSSTPQLLNMVLADQGGVVSNTVRANVVAPIPFHYGSYAKTGVFGGLALGSDVNEFHTAAVQVRDSIDSQRDTFQSGILWIALVAILLLAGAAILVARGVTHPVRRLTDAARIMERGELDTATLLSVIDRNLHDEVTKLAQVFKQMAEQVQLRERALKEQIQELRIEIDQQKKAQQVAELTDTTYFRELQSRATQMRARHARAPAAAGDGGNGGNESAS